MTRKNEHKEKKREEMLLVLIRFFIAVLGSLTNKKVKKKRRYRLIYLVQNQFCSNFQNGGVAGIRTLGKLSPTQPFQDCTLNRSDTTPFLWCPFILSNEAPEVKRKLKKIFRQVFG